ncbi:MAG TPA: Rieske 2Fe-2S domain-containing protein [Anaerolineales bacterium]|nr:Rieske 2Fe-2S domain-containing protein [Anaerolineales bacterium]
MPSNDLEGLPVRRRDFLALATRAVLWLTGGAAAVGLGRYLTYQLPAEPATRFTLEAPEAYPPGTRVLVADAGAAIYRDQSGYFARSLTCGHLGCRVHPSDDGGFACPCHGSQFSRDGARVNGPTARDLNGVALSLDDQGHLVIDMASKVDPTWRLMMDATAGGRSQDAAADKG